jgi:hypothetical protein
VKVSGEGSWGLEENLISTEERGVVKKDRLLVEERILVEI